MSGIKDWIGLTAAVIGLLVGVKLLMANPIEARLDRMEARMNARFDNMQSRFDEAQIEDNRRFELLLEAITGFERRLAHVEGRLDAQDTSEDPAAQP